MHRTRSVYVIFTSIANESLTSGPNETRYYSQEDGGVYHLYQLVTALCRLGEYRHSNDALGSMKMVSFEDE